jgi:hypothetical protein
MSPQRRRSHPWRDTFEWARPHPIWALVIAATVVVLIAIGSATGSSSTPPAPSVPPLPAVTTSSAVPAGVASAVPSPTHSRKHKRRHHHATPAPPAAVTSGLHAAHGFGWLLRAGRVLPRLRSRRDGRRWGRRGDQVRVQQRLAVGTGIASVL